MRQTAGHTDVEAVPASAPAPATTPTAQAQATAQAVADPASLAALQNARSDTAAQSPVMATPPRSYSTATQVPSRPVLGQPPTAAGSLGGTLFALVLVVGLILALGWLLKRMPGFNRGAGGNGLRVVASLPVGVRERVVVVDVNGTQLLLGVGSGGVRTLHVLDAPLPLDNATQTPQFAQLLAQHFGKKA